MQWCSRLEMEVRVFMIVLCLGSGIYGNLYVDPEQIHLSYGLDPTEMTITWSTMNATESSLVRYGPGSPALTASGYSTRFVDPGTTQHTQYIHRVTVTRLEPGQTYVYQVGSIPEGAWSATYHFPTMRLGTKWAPRVALYGDMGYVNAQSMKRLMTDEAAGIYDAVFHIGDFAYDFDYDEGKLGDRFMNLIQPLAANLPYMTCPGNHEYHFNFTHYKNRFTMPGDPRGDRMYYSLNMGPAHVISFSTEYIFYPQFGLQPTLNQYNWLKADLEEATKPENRAKRPWIITMGHRPMYCSNGFNDCELEAEIVRNGLPVIHAPGFEKLFWDYGVDLELWAHEHSYERLWPVYQEKVHNGSYEAPYTNPRAPVHIITGSAGCRERHGHFKNVTADWSAYRNNDYGYSRMTVHNDSHLYMEQVSDDKQGMILDTMWLIKDKHGPYN